MRQTSSLGASTSIRVSVEELLEFVTREMTSSSGGFYAALDAETEAVDEDAFQYLKLAFKDDVIVGALALGLTSHVGVIRGLIQTRVPLGHWKDRLMKDPHRVMEAYLVRTQGSSYGY